MFRFKFSLSALRANDIFDLHFTGSSYARAALGDVVVKGAIVELLSSSPLQPRHIFGVFGSLQAFLIILDGNNHGNRFAFARDNFRFATGCTHTNKLTLCLCFVTVSGTNEFLRVRSAHQQQVVPLFQKHRFDLPIPLSTWPQFP